MAAAPNRIAFTDDRLTRTAPPARGEVFLYDTKKPGLICRITAQGVKTFAMYRRVRGVPRKFKLGRLGAMTVEEARSKVDELSVRINKGEDPAPDRVGPRTLGDVFGDYLEKRAKVRKRTWGHDVYLYEKYLQASKAKRFEEVDVAWVRQVHRRVGATTPITANRLLALLSVLFTFERGRNASNPCRDVERYPERQRARRLTAEELPRFVAALDKLVDEGGTQTMADLLRVLLSTGQRRGNVYAMRWADLDLKSGTWTIPGEVFKNGQPHVAMLPPNIVTLLQRRRFAAKGEYVFPGRRSGAPHVIDCTGAWRHALRLAGIDRKTIRLHDLRATFATLMAENKENLQTIAAQLGHRDIGTTQRYVRLAQEAVRSAVDRTAAAMDEMARVKESA
jgi:integrase